MEQATGELPPLNEKKTTRYEFPKFVGEGPLRPETVGVVGEINTLMSALHTLDDSTSLHFPLSERASDEVINGFITHNTTVFRFYETIRTAVAMQSNCIDPGEKSAIQFAKTAAFLSNSDPEDWRCADDGKGYKFYLDGNVQPITLTDVREKIFEVLKDQTDQMAQTTEQSAKISGVIHAKHEIHGSEVQLTEEDIQLLLVKQRMSIHEIGSAMAVLSDIQNLQRAKESFPQDVPQILENMKDCYTWVQNVLKSSKRIFSEKYSAGSLTIDTVRNNLNAAISRGLPPRIQVRIDESMYTLKDEAVIWDESFIQLLGDTVAQNTLKAYKDRKKSNVRIQPDVTIRAFRDGNALCLGFRDRGNGYSQELLDQGFVKGLGGWGRKDIDSNKIGLATHREILTKVYKGELYPTNVIDDQGNIIGGELIVKLPLHHE